MTIEEIEKKLEDAESSGYVCPACGSLPMRSTKVPIAIRDLIAQVREAEKVLQRIVDVGEINSPFPQDGRMYDVAKEYFELRRKAGGE